MNLPDDVSITHPNFNDEEVQMCPDCHGQGCDNCEGTGVVPLEYDEDEDEDDPTGSYDYADD
jgi:hypothetical protein